MKMTRSIHLDGRLPTVMLSTIIGNSWREDHAGKGNKKEADGEPSASRKR
jgi:hypothetical protein